MATIQPTNTAQSGIQVYSRLLKYLRPHIWPFMISIFGYLLFAMSQPALAKLMEVLVNAIEQKDANARFYVPALIIGIYMVRGFGSFLGSYYMAFVATRIVVSLRMEMFAHVMHLPTRFFDAHSSGQITSKIIFNTGMVTGAATDALKVLVREGFTVIGLLAFAFYTNWQMTVYFLLLAPLIAVIVTVVGRRLRKLSTKVQDSIADITHICTEAIGASRTVKSLLAEDRETNRFHRVNERNMRQQMSMVKTQALVTPTLQTLIIMVMGLIVSLMLQPAFLESMNTGAYISYITAIALLPKPVKQLSDINATIQKGIAASISLFEVLDEPTEVNTGGQRIAQLTGAIQVRDLAFTYSGQDAPALKGISFSAEPGSVIALVGRSGSGKSTLASLLARLYDFQEGTIQVDGKDIREYDLYDYRRSVGTVSQSVSLFNDTIESNIAYGDPNAEQPDSEKIRQAAKDAHALDFIDKLPEGMQTMVGENGTKLSGGQKQRIAIARTLVKDTPILILDEATSALDNESERAIQAALENFMRDRTTIVIAHRLTTVEKADQILVMDDGKIVERGRHQELLDANGYYAMLYQQDFVEQS